MIIQNWKKKKKSIKIFIMKLGTLELHKKEGK